MAVKIQYIYNLIARPRLFPYPTPGSGANMRYGARRVQAYQNSAMRDGAGRKIPFLPTTSLPLSSDGFQIAPLQIQYSMLRCCCSPLPTGNRADLLQFRIIPIIRNSVTAVTGACCCLSEIVTGAGCRTGAGCCIYSSYVCIYSGDMVACTGSRDTV